MNRLKDDIKCMFIVSPFGRTKCFSTMRYLVKRRYMDEAIDTHYKRNVNPERRRELKKKMRDAMIRYRWGFDEFFAFDYENLSNEQRRMYAPDYDKNIFAETVNNHQKERIFQDKWLTYQYFKEFYARDIFNIRTIKDIGSKECSDFLQGHSTFMLKPAYGTYGEGIEKIHTADIEKTKEHIKSVYRSGVHSIILEELIEQSQEIAAIHPESVNTLRVRTVNINGKVKFLYPSFRLGKGNSFVDNASTGGILCNIDVETGVVYSASDKQGNNFMVHPDTGVPIIGFKIPQWDEAKKLVINLCNVIPEVRYTGWDIALSAKGWVMVEGNARGQWGFQYSNKKGFRDEMNAILRELGKKEITV